MVEVEARFWELCDIASRHDESRHRKLCDESVSPDEAELEARACEQAMVDIIGLVEKHPEHRWTFVRCFSDLALWKRRASFLLVPFCMRRLRFPEIHELLAQDAKAHEGTAYYASHMNYWSAVNHAYLDEVWESALCFDFYRHEDRQARSNPHRTETNP